MDCSFLTAESSKQCASNLIDFFSNIRPLLELGVALWGVGTLAFVVLTVWAYRRLKREMDRVDGDNTILRQASLTAEREKDEAVVRAKRAEKNLGRALDDRNRTANPVEEQVSELNSELTRLRHTIDQALDLADDAGAGFWSRPPGNRLDNYERRLSDSIPIMLFANQKGGVGKTTLAANIAAAFAERGERVLVLDLDYQGSMTSLMLAQAGTRPEEFPSAVDQLLSEELNPLWAKAAIANASENLDYISCWYPFERLERALEFRWTLEATTDDVRYRFARALLSKTVQGTYDRVILDAPPRMTAGFMNGFCTSTHLFVPTVVDNVAGVAAGTFARQFSELVPIVNPVIKFAGIIGTMTSYVRRGGIPNTAKVTADGIERVVQKQLNTTEQYFFETPMQHTPRIARSTDEGIAYLKVPETQTMFNDIADEIARRAPRR